MTSKIYKISCEKTNDFYIGSTTYNLNDRLSYHRSRAKRGEKNKLHSTMKDLGIKNWKIEEYCTCDNDKQLELENAVILLLKPQLNSNRSSTGIKRDDEYYKNYRTLYKDELKEKAREYYLKNQDKIKEYNRNRYTKKKDI
jgi:hypothetical protein